MNSKFEDESYMRRAIELASLGAGFVSPNPMVGCVIVHENKIIGEGWHERLGEGHAEVNAINSVSKKNKLKESTVYVSLEPCAHHGKTPPCADLLVKHKVRRVVISNTDPNPKVAGKGIKKLEDAGIAVTTGVLSQMGKELNKRFFCSFKNNRPYIILKWAETSDGFIARENYDSKWISNEYSRQLVHKWRSEEGSILVGKNTAKYDNPSLTVRDWSGRNPVRVVVDHKLVLNRNLHLFDSTTPTICYNLTKDTQEGVTYVALPEDDFMNAMLKDLNNRGINSLIVEGGSRTLQEFLDKNLWDEARVFISKQRFEKGISAPSIKGLAKEEIIQGDKLLVYKN